MKTKITLLLALFLLLMGCARLEGAGNQREDVDETDTVDTTPTPRPTTPPPASSTVLADGQLVAVNPILTLGFETNGRLLAVAVQPGDEVAAGDLIATLDDAALQDTVTNAALQVSQSENSLAQAQLSLDNLLTWEPDATAVALAEANLIAAQTTLTNALSSDAAAGNSVTSARVSLDQAQRSLTDAQEAYDTAFDPGREWEFGIRWMKEQLENERDAAVRNLQFAEENLEVARAQFSLALAGLNNDSAVSAEAGVVSAQQALEQANTGPKEAEIAAARLQVTQAELSLQQSQFSLQQAEEALDKAELRAPWAGTVLTVDAATGATIAAGTPIITLLDTAHLQFHTSNLSERDLGQINPGQPVEVVLKTFADQLLTGSVAGIAPQAAGTVGDAAVFTVLMDLDATDLPLRPGMTGRVEIINPE